MRLPLAGGACAYGGLATHRMSRREVICQWLKALVPMQALPPRRSMRIGFEAGDRPWGLLGQGLSGPRPQPEAPPARAAMPMVSGRLDGLNRNACVGFRVPVASAATAGRAGVGSARAASLTHRFSGHRAALLTHALARLKIVGCKLRTARARWQRRDRPDLMASYLRTELIARAAFAGRRVGLSVVAVTLAVVLNPATAEAGCGDYVHVAAQAFLTDGERSPTAGQGEGTLPRIPCRGVRCDGGEPPAAPAAPVGVTSASDSCALLSGTVSVGLPRTAWAEGEVPSRLPPAWRQRIERPPRCRV